MIMDNSATVTTKKEPLPRELTLSMASEFQLLHLVMSLLLLLDLQWHLKSTKRLLCKVLQEFWSRTHRLLQQSRALNEVEADKAWEEQSQRLLSKIKVISHKWLGTQHLKFPSKILRGDKIAAQERLISSKTSKLRDLLKILEDHPQSLSHKGRSPKNLSERVQARSFQVFLQPKKYTEKLSIRLFQTDLHWDHLGLNQKNWRETKALPVPEQSVSTTEEIPKLREVGALERSKLLSLFQEMSNSNTRLQAQFMRRWFWLLERRKKIWQHHWPTRGRLLNLLD